MYRSLKNRVVKNECASSAEHPDLTIQARAWYCGTAGQRQYLLQHASLHWKQQKSLYLKIYIYIYISVLFFIAFLEIF